MVLGMAAISALKRAPPGEMVFPSALAPMTPSFAVRWEILRLRLRTRRETSDALAAWKVGSESKKMTPSEQAVRAYSYALRSFYGLVDLLSTNKPGAALFPCGMTSSAKGYYDAQGVVIGDVFL